MKKQLTHLETLALADKALARLGTLIELRESRELTIDELAEEIKIHTFLDNLYNAFDKVLK